MRLELELAQVELELAQVELELPCPTSQLGQMQVLVGTLMWLL